MKQIDQKTIIESSQEYLKKAGFDAKVYPAYEDGEDYLVLFHGVTPENFDLTIHPNIEFSVRPDEDSVNIGELYVLPPFEKRKGVGSKLVKALGEFSKSIGRNKMTAYALSTEEAQEFWKSIPCSKQVGEPRNYEIPLD